MYLCILFPNHVISQIAGPTHVATFVRIVVVREDTVSCNLYLFAVDDDDDTDDDDEVWIIHTHGYVCVGEGRDRILRTPTCNSPTTHK